MKTSLLLVLSGLIAVVSTAALAADTTISIPYGDWLGSASGGRILQKNKDGSYTNIKTGTVSAGSSGKHYDLLEEAGAYN